MNYFENQEFQEINKDEMSKELIISSINNPKDNKTKSRLVISIMSLGIGLAIGAFAIAPNFGRAKTNQASQVNQAIVEQPQNNNPTTQIKIGAQTTNTQSLSTPDIVENTVDSVVGISIKTSKTSTRTGQTSESESGSGSGIIISSEGHIITNNHVIDGADSIYVILKNSEEEIKATLVGRDAVRDIAVIKIEKTGLKVAAIGDSSAVRVGETVLAIGNPLGSMQGSVTQGIVSAVDRDVYMEGNNNNYIQTDAAINPGNSGGALVNQRGEVIAINTLKSVVAGYDSSGQVIASEGIGFAIPISDAVEIAEEIIQYGKYTRPGVGVTIYEISTEESLLAKVPKGLLVKSVSVGGEAEKAGLKANDIITKVNNSEISTTESFKDIITKSKTGDIIAVEIWREERTASGEITQKELSINITVGDINDMNDAAQKAATQTQQNNNSSGITEEDFWSMLP